MDVDFYADNAEWYAALVAPGRAATAGALRRLAGDLTGGVAVEIGAGIGTAVPVLRSLGAARIFAIEPSPAMRVGLMTTLGADADLLARTTSLPGDLAGQLHRLPERWAGAVMLNAIGHLDDGARTHLWHTLGERLAPGGRFVLSLQPPQRPEAIPWTDFGAVSVGEHELRTRGRADPVDEAYVHWTMEWSLHDGGGELIERRTAVSRWRALAVADVVAEGAGAGLRLADEVPDLGALALVRE